MSEPDHDRSGYFARNVARILESGAMRFPVSSEIFKGTHFTAIAFYKTFFYLIIVWKHKCLIQVSWQQVNGKGIIVEIVNTDCMADLT